MGGYWVALVAGAKSEGAAIVADMVPVLALIFGVVFAERVARLFLGLIRR
jgi:hypothetical protein